MEIMTARSELSGPSRSGSLARRLRIYSITATAALAAAVAISPIHAVALTAPQYSHSWYVTTHNNSTMYNRGYADGGFDSQHCTGSMVVLDFGQITQEPYSGSQYNQYGTYDFGETVYVSDDQILSLAESYASGWWDGSTSCPFLTLDFGTNNYNECPYGYSLSSCAVGTAGTEWAALAANFNGWLHIRHYYGAGQYWTYSEQIQSATADDIESGYDCATKTEPFVTDYTNADSGGFGLYDFGDFFQNGSCWTVGELYYVAWGGYYSWNLPETYTNGQINAAIAVEQTSGTMQPSGNMTTCSGGDPVPEPTCSNGWYAPTGGWNALYNAQASAGLQQGTMAWSTNIQYQP